jgi:hypothetical protein
LADGLDGTFLVNLEPTFSIGAAHQLVHTHREQGTQS